MANLVNFHADVVQLLIDNENFSAEITEELKEAVASVTKNPNITWAKFILTDDKPNRNKQRVPAGEFDNLILSGIHMPIKMAFGGISEGHDYTSPIGAITHLQKYEDNKVVGLAALWNSERPEDIGIIKEKFNKKEPLDLSWELTYSSSEEDENSGVQDLLGVNLKAATLVGVPAYNGRTPITAVASKENEGEETLDELEKIKTQLGEVQNENTELKDKISKMEAEASDRTKELEELRSFKSDIEAEREKAARMESIKGKFAEAGLEKDEAYFEEKGEILLSFDANALDFFIQEAVAFAKTSNENNDESNSSASTKKVPNFRNNENEDQYNFKEMAEALRKSD